MARPVRVLSITDAQRRELQMLARRPTSTQREAWRAQIILHRADGLSQEETARRVEVNRPVVSLWEKRFVQAGLAGLADARPQADNRARHPERDPQPGDAAAAKPKALERTHDGQGDGGLEGHGAAAVERQ